MEAMSKTVADFLAQQSWQLPVVFGPVLAGTWGLRKASAHWRYLLWLVVIAKCLTPPMFSLPLAVLPRATELKQSERNVADVSSMSPETELLSANGHSQPMTTSKLKGQASVAALPAAEMSRPPVSIQFDLRPWLVLAWMFVVGTLLTYMSGRVWATHRRLKRTRLPANDQTRKTVAVLAEKLGMRRTPTVYMADSVAQPFVWGWLRGDIYLPLQFCRTGTVEQRKAILTHELAHVLRWDAAVNHIQNVLQAVFFFHPLIWWSNQMIRREREKCCDEIVLSASCTSPKVYCEAIVNMLAGEYASRQSTPALAVTGSTKNIKERITTMLTPNRKFRRRPSRAAVATMLLVAACVLPTSLVVTTRAENVATQEQSEKADSKETKDSKNTKTQDNGTWQAGQVMDFRVINADTKEPLADVTLELQNMGPGIDFQDVKIQKTDADGWSRIPLPNLPPTAVRVYPIKEGFVPLRVYWAAEPHPTMPKSITIPMEPGKKFGGTVRNEAGEPVPDVTVTVHFWATGKGENPHVRANIDVTTTTDKNGRWHVDIMPAEFDNKKDLRIYFHHPEYVSDHLKRAHWPIPVTEQPVLGELFDQTAVMIMRRGETIEGKVVDKDGQPIPNAAIHDSEHYWLSPGKPRATTDNNGKFRIAGVTYSEDVRFEPDHRGRILTVQATGYAPELIPVVPNSPTLDVQLESGKSAHGRIVDEAGKPLEGVDVSAGRWRNWDGRLHLQTSTDAEGRFHVKDIPTDGVEFSVSKEGYMYVSKFPMSPSDNEYQLTLRAPVRIVGSVVDAANGKPLDRFVLITGIDPEDGRTTFWFRDTSRTIVKEGRFESTLKQAEFSWRLRLEAEGYMPSVSRIFRLYNPDKGEVHYDFKLTKAAPLTGTVLGLDGKPLANADVYLATQPMNIQDRKVRWTENPPTKTDAAGRLELPAEVEPFCLVVVHEQGVAMITEEEFKSPPSISIQPWTDKNQRLQIIRRPAPQQSVDFPNKYP